MPLSSSQLFRSILRILHSSSSSSSLEPTSLPILRPHPHPCLVVNRCATSAYSHTAAPWCLRKEIDENPGSGTDVKKPCRIDSISSGVYLCTCPTKVSGVCFSRGAPLDPLEIFCKKSFFPWIKIAGKTI
ncbi:hypothetical protein BHE74_00001121 [Ensete ventricosum]|nr:hypothetical protein BHE74_00001121 [Ensete ventricosum]